jgi:hypothetical protein
MKKHGQPSSAVEMTDGRTGLMSAFRQGVANSGQQRMMANWMRDICAHHKLPPRYAEQDLMHKRLMAGDLSGAGEQHEAALWIERLLIGNLTTQEKILIMENIPSIPPYMLTKERQEYLAALTTGVVGQIGQGFIAAWIKDLHVYMGRDPRGYSSDPLWLAMKAGTLTDHTAMGSVADWLKRLIEEASQIQHRGKPVPVPGATANERQVGGSHYQSTTGIQHWDLAVAFELPYLAGQITKYVTRAHRKNGIQDLEKAMHFMDKLIETEAAKSAEDDYIDPPDIWKFGRDQGLADQQTEVIMLIIMFERTGQPDLLHMAKAGLARIMDLPTPTVG